MFRYLKIIFISLLISSCTRLHHIESLPKDVYTISDASVMLRPDSSDGVKQNRRNIRKVEVEQTDSILTFTPQNRLFPARSFSLSQINNLRLHRHTFDIDILTIPFKIRPSAEGFPEQLNANFSAALYLGRRRDIYRVKTGFHHSRRISKISGVGLGYGGFVGLGGVTMNPFVTRGKIAYEYDGMVITSGLAAVYDAKKFNIGLALGTDFLVDKNRQDWLYQGKPWFGVLLGINLN